MLRRMINPLAVAGAVTAPRLARRRRRAPLLAGGALLLLSLVLAWLG